MERLKQKLNKYPFLSKFKVKDKKRFLLMVQIFQIISIFLGVFLFNLIYSLFFQIPFQMIYTITPYLVMASIIFLIYHENEVLNALILSSILPMIIFILELIQGWFGGFNLINVISFTSHTFPIIIGVYILLKKFKINIYIFIGAEIGTYIWYFCVRLTGGYANFFFSSFWGALWIWGINFVLIMLIYWKLKTRTIDIREIVVEEKGKFTAFIFKKKHHKKK